MDALSSDIRRLLERLGARLDQLATTILRAEAILMRGGACALPEPLGSVYRRRAQCSHPIARFRWPNIERLVGERRRQLAEVRRAVPAANVAGEVRVTTRLGEQVWRSILDPLFWGILIVPSHVAEWRAFEDQLWGGILESLARDLDDLLDIEVALTARRTCAAISVVPDPLGAALEVLVADILNERALHATPATLREDVLEKVDLHVHRPVHARVQVTWIIDEERHDQKVAALEPEAVVISPRTLALALRSRELVLAPATRSRLARILGAGDDLETSARSMRGIFEHAIRSRHDDPRGPAAAMPVEVRELVRECVVSGLLEVRQVSRSHPRLRVA